MEDPSASAQNIHENIATAVILTALPLEAAEVLKHLESLRGEFCPDTQAAFDCGTFQGNSLRWNVAVAECGAGNIRVTHLVHIAVRRFRPAVLFFVGVAGGIKDVRILDVVAGSKIYEYHAGKDTGEFFPRPNVEPTCFGLDQIARYVCRRRRWQDRLHRSGHDIHDKVTAIVGPIAAGEQVVASNNSAALAILKRFYSDAVSVEEEGYGFLNTARFYSAPALVVRGISDLCEGKTAGQDEKLQPQAAACAAAFTFEVLAHWAPPAHFFDLPHLRVAGSSDAVLLPPAIQWLSPLSESGANSVSSDEIRNRLRTLGAGLLANGIPSDQWIPRSAESEIDAALADADRRLICLLGQPGSGKTALLSRLAERSLNAGRTTLAFKADLASPQLPFTEWLQEQLGLPIGPLQTVTRLASEEPVVIFVDQLDALAGLVDLHSERLNDVLRFVDDCLRLPNVRVVCSCREFEFRHDTRFSVLEAKEIQLELPPWEFVIPQLERAGITGSDTWSPAFREMLRTPLHLKVFIEARKQSDVAEVFRSYQAMLDVLWRRSVNTQPRRDLVYRITGELTERESLWIPEAQIEESLGTVEELIAAGILTRQKGQIGFIHQTFLEYARGRLFVRSDRSLSQHVIARQDAILVRPTLWYVLHYLRDADHDKYATELNDLFASDLRLHVRYLLIDFLGRQSDPREHEVAHLASRLKDSEDRGRMLLAIRGSQQWFEQLKNTHLGAAMTWATADAWPMVGVISAAWTFARSDCLSLIKEYWLTDATKDNLTIQSLQTLEVWDDAAVDIVCRLVERADQSRLWWAEDLASAISVSKPELACRVAGRTIQKTLDRRTEVKEGPPNRYSSPLEWTNEWHELPEIVKAAPSAFLKEVWPLFCQWAKQFHEYGVGTVLRKYGGWSLAFDLDEQPIGRPISTSLIIAVEETAKKAPEEFVSITGNSWGIPSAVVQGMIARGLALSCPTNADIALDFLRSDPRRFSLGSFYNGEQHDSIQLISAICPHLSPDQMTALEQAILGWSKYRDDQIIEECQVKWDREARLRLLKAIPEQLLSEQTREFARLEEASLPDWKERLPRRPRAGFVREISPLTKEQMAEATDEKVLEFLRGPEEPEGASRSWNENEDRWTRDGGARAARRALADLAKDNPSRVLPILRKAMAEGNEEAVCGCLHNLADAPLPDGDMFQFLLELTKDLDLSEEFRSQASYVFYRRCREGKGLPSDVCELLESWLDQPWDNSYRVFSEDNSERQDEKEPQSVLWGYSGGAIDCDRSFWTLAALTYGYLLQTPASTSRWLDVLERHVERKLSGRTWSAFCRDLHWITAKGSDRERGARFLARLFDRYPDVAISVEGLRLVAMTAYGVPAEFLDSYLDRLRTSGDPHLIQAYGELLVLISLRDTGHTSVKRRAERDLLSLDSMDSQLREPFLVGVGFAAAQLWDEPEVRHDVIAIFERAVQFATTRVTSALSTIFWSQHDFVDDEHTEKLLRLVASNPQLVSGRFILDCAEHLSKLCKFQRTTVLDTANALVVSRAKQSEEFKSEFYLAGPHLVNISMTLQRFPETRSEGLTLLESLMRLGVGDAYAMLDEIDIRPGAAKSRTPLRRRRRRGS